MGYQRLGQVGSSWRALSGAVAAVACVALLAAAPVQAATTSHPAGGSDFSTDAQGWAGSDTSCSPAVGVLCSASTPYEPGVGSPAGSISMRVDVVVNTVGSFQGAGTWTSPPFTVPAGQEVTGATFRYDRQLDVGGLLDLQPQSTITVTLVDQGAGSTATLLSEQLGAADVLARRGVGVAADAVVAGQTYRLRIDTSTTSSVAGVGVVGQANTRFDNIALAVDQASSDSGGGGGTPGGSTPIVSPGVTIASGPLSSLQIGSLFGRFDENTEVGRGPGGPLVPPAQCTIVGTAGPDRITGTRGNDVICGLGGNDVLAGAGGIDVIDGAGGNDRLSGGSAKDQLIGLRGKDRLGGGAGNDRIGGGAGRDRVSGSAGADRLGGGSGKDALRGARGNDRLTAGKGRDRILAGPGRDRISARDRRRDVVDGGKGRDRATVDRRARGARSTRGNLRRVDRVRRVERLR
jgi:Ca2+-binding RTX toxin-like protein